MTKYFATDNISHCSWQVGILIEQQVYCILVPWTCPSVRINTDRWRTKGRIEIEPAGIFSSISLCKSSLEVAHAMAKHSQIHPCANVDCFLSKHDLGMMWVSSEGCSSRLPQRGCGSGGEECHRLEKRKKSLDSIAALSLDQTTVCVACVDPPTQIPHECVA